MDFSPKMFLLRDYDPFPGVVTVLFLMKKKKTNFISVSLFCPSCTATQVENWAFGCWPVIDNDNAFTGK